MSKKIIAVALCVLMIAIVFVACGKKNDNKETNAPVEYTTDTDGNLFVTNINGELIPVTTGKDGTVELLDDLVTKTMAQVEKEKENISKEESQNNNADNTVPSSTEDTTVPPTGVNVGTDSLENGNHDAVINWN